MLFIFIVSASIERNEVVNVNLFTKPEWMASKNPLTKVPILELDDKLVYESLITADYLDELYPGARLLNSSDPFKKAQDRIFMELFQQVNLINPSSILYIINILYVRKLCIR